MADRTGCVFVNCPFDPDFKPLHDAILFTIAICGYAVRSALEVADSGDLRLSKILRLLEQSRLSIHDISRVELDAHGLPRFNMPLELGIALGMKHLGRRNLRDHALLVLDSQRYRYRQFASDLAGVDPAAHENDPRLVIAQVRDFLASTTDRLLPSASPIADALTQFEHELPALARSAKQVPAELTYGDRLQHINAFAARFNT